MLETVDLSDRNDETAVASLGKVLGDSGRKQEARKVLEELEERSKHRYMSPYLIALVQIGLGERNQAIASLEQGYTNRDQWMTYLKVDPQMDDLRSDPRFPTFASTCRLSLMSSLPQTANQNRASVNAHSRKWAGHHREDLEPLGCIAGV
jgi:hypothetical protein